MTERGRDCGCIVCFGDICCGIEIVITLFCSKKSTFLPQPTHKPWKPKMVLGQVQPQISLFFHLPHLRTPTPLEDTYQETLLEKGNLKSFWLFLRCQGVDIQIGFLRNVFIQRRWSSADSQLALTLLNVLLILFRAFEARSCVCILQSVVAPMSR